VLESASVPTQTGATVLQYQNTDPQLSRPGVFHALKELANDRPVGVCEIPNRFQGIGKQISQKARAFGMIVDLMKC